MKLTVRGLSALGAFAVIAAWVLGQGGAASAAPGALAGSARSAAVVARSGTLYPGMHGAAIKNLQPVSHGCVRIPMDVAAFFHTLVHISESNGTPVYVRGHAPGT
jgi:hypothetical protein